MTSLSGSQGQHHEQVRSVVRYYDGTWFDYRWVWLNSENNAIIFAYRDAARRRRAAYLPNPTGVLAEFAAIQRGEGVLDAGCGIAGSSVWLAERRGATVVGIPPVRMQVERARRIAAAR